MFISTSAFIFTGIYVFMHLCISLFTFVIHTLKFDVFMFILIFIYSFTCFTYTIYVIMCVCACDLIVMNSMEHPTSFAVKCLWAQMLVDIESSALKTFGFWHLRPDLLQRPRPEKSSPKAMLQHLPLCRQSQSSRTFWTQVDLGWSSPFEHCWPVENHIHSTPQAPRHHCFGCPQIAFHQDFLGSRRFLWAACSSFFLFLFTIHFKAWIFPRPLDEPGIRICRAETEAITRNFEAWVLRFCTEGHVTKARAYTLSWWYKAKVRICHGSKKRHGSHGRLKLGDLDLSTPLIDLRRYDICNHLQSIHFVYLFPQQRKLMGSSAQNSSGVHWCGRRVKFNEVPEKVPKVPEKVPKVPEKVWEALVQSRIRFNRIPEKVPEKVWEALVSGSTGLRRRFRRRFWRRSGRLWCRARSGSTGFQTRFRSLGAKPSQVQQGSGEGSEALMQSQVRFNRVPEKVPGSLGAKPSQVQQGSGEGSRESSGEGRGAFGAEPSSTGFRRRFREALMQSQVRFNKVPEKVPGSRCAKLSQVQRVPEKVPKKVGEAFVQSQVMFNRVPENVQQKVPGSLGAKPNQIQRVPENVPEKAWEALVQSQVRFNRVPEKVPEKVWKSLVQSQVKFNRVPERFRRRCGRLWRGAKLKGSGEGSGRLWCRDRSGSTGFRRRFRGEGLGGFGAEPGWVQQGSEKVPEKVPRRRSGRLWCRARSSSTGVRRRFRRRSWESLVQGQVRFNRFRRRFRRRFHRRLRRSLLFFFLFSCMCTRHTWMSLEHNCALRSLS